MPAVCPLRPSPARTRLGLFRSGSSPSRCRHWCSFTSTARTQPAVGGLQVGEDDRALVDRERDELDLVVEDTFESVGELVGADGSDDARELCGGVAETGMPASIIECALPTASCAREPPNRPTEARFSLRVFTLSLAPFGPPLTLAPRLPRVTRTPGAIFSDFRKLQPTVRRRTRR